MNQREWLSEDYYAALGVPADASTDDIKQAFRTLAKQHHPDVNGHDPSAHLRFAEVSRANAVLSDDESRRAYDEVRATAPPPAPDEGWDAVVHLDGFGDPAQGWFEDPFDRHDYRWFSVGRATALVRDTDLTGFDDPPGEVVVGPLVAAPYTPRRYETTRVGDGTDPETEQASSNYAAGWGFRRRPRRE